MSGSISLLAIILSTIALVTSLVAIVLVLAQRWSTHKIEWKPLVTSELPEAEKFKEEEIEASESEALSSAIEMSKKAKKKREDKDPLEEILQSNNF